MKARLTYLPRRRGKLSELLADFRAAAGTRTPAPPTALQQYAANEAQLPFLPTI